jgi:hypothetical protein
VEDLIAAARPDDVVGGDRGQRTFITLSRPVLMVRGASDRPTFTKAVLVSSEPIPRVVAEPVVKPEPAAVTSKRGKKQKSASAAAAHEKTRRKRKRSKVKPVTVKAKKVRKDREEPDFTKLTESGTQFASPKPLRKARKKLCGLQRRLSRAALIPLPEPKTAELTPEKLEAKAARKALRKERKGLSKRGKLRLRADIGRRNAEERRCNRAASAKKRADANVLKLELVAKRKALRKAGLEDEAKALCRPAKRQRKSKRGSRLATKISGVHADVANSRDDVQHKLTTVVTRQVKVLCLDRVPGNGGFGASDAGLANMRQKFLYKGALDGCLVIDACQYFPSSKRCSVCGNIHAGLKRGDETWTCPVCGEKHDRDGNAAVNLAWYGRIALSILKGGETARTALAGLSVEEQSWFMVGRAKAEPPERATRGETDDTPQRRSESGSREGIGKEMTHVST